MDTIEFTEVQRFRRWWAWVGVLAMNTLFICAIIQQIFLGKPFGNKPAPDYVLILLESFFLLLLIFMFSIRLTTTISDKGICYKYFPLQLKTTCIEWNELNDAYIRYYNSFLEYGGYGIRVGSPHRGRAINTSASSTQGLQLQFKDGRLLLIGTRRPEEIREIIDRKIAVRKINPKK